MKSNTLDDVANVEFNQIKTVNLCNNNTLYLFYLCSFSYFISNSENINLTV